MYLLGLFKKKLWPLTECTFIYTLYIRQYMKSNFYKTEVKTARLLWILQFDCQFVFFKLNKVNVMAKFVGRALNVKKCLQVHFIAVLSSFIFKLNFIQTLVWFILEKGIPYYYLIYWYHYTHIHVLCKLPVLLHGQTTLMSQK